MQLKRAGIHKSWSGLRTTLSNQRRVTASMRRKDGRTVRVCATARRRDRTGVVLHGCGLQRGGWWRQIADQPSGQNHKFNDANKH